MCFDKCIMICVCVCVCVCVYTHHCNFIQNSFTYRTCAALCLVTQSCPTLCDPMDCTPPGSSIHGDSPGKNTGVDCHALLQGIFPTKGLKPDLRYCRWILYHLSHQGSPRILEWVAYPFSRGRRHRCISSVQFSSVQSLSCVRLFATP